MAKTATRKVLLCSDKWERDYFIDRLRYAASRDDTYSFRERGSSYELLVHDWALGTSFLVNTVSTNQWSWPQHLLGLKYDEVHLSDAGYRVMEDRTDLHHVVQRRNMPGKNPLHCNALLFMMLNDSKAEATMGNKLLDIEHFGRAQPSLARTFDLPPTLFRRRMLPYFEDLENPTRDEFLFAVTLEGVSASTTREKAAIEATELHVEGEGHETDSCAVEQGQMGVWLQEYCTLPRPTPTGAGWSVRYPPGANG